MDAVTEPARVSSCAVSARLFVIVATAIALFALRLSPAIGLVLGLTFALSFGNPCPSHTRSLSQRTLAISVVGLGAGMNLIVVGRLGLHGLGVTVSSIVLALLLGSILGRRFGVPRDTALLISVGTAICGGSAIAAVAPTIRARDQDISVALATIFLLNSVALFVFPSIGHSLNLSQDSFGLWSALAIHDTSSVVGAAAQYGPRALEVATATKLTRALWIVPVTFAIAAYRARTTNGAKSASARPKIPWFIGAFVLVAALVTYAPSLRGVGHMVSLFAHRLLTVTLFLVGLGLSGQVARSLGAKPLLQAVTLWLLLGTVTLAGVTMSGP